METLELKKVAEGKTKVLFEHPSDPRLLVAENKDAITAGDGARRSELPGKAALACRTTCNVFELLNSNAVPTHYKGGEGDKRMVIEKCEMIPVEFVMRRLATGGYLKRHPETSEGTRFDELVIEFFLKDDARHDPLVTEKELVDAGTASQEELSEMKEVGVKVFEALEEAWAKQDVVLVDLKIEFGRNTEGGLVVADVIDNDSWRLWPHGRREEMLDKQVYRELPEVTDEGLRKVLANYARVAEMTDKFLE